MNLMAVEARIWSHHRLLLLPAAADSMNTVRLEIRAAGSRLVVGAQGANDLPGVLRPVRVHREDETQCL